ncbi:1841_t:CDS:2 [Entrophospora sp. SA101]|nr:1841_t:CDS:2 [Entrophospora sp. SA101]
MSGIPLDPNTSNPVNTIINAPFNDTTLLNQPGSLNANNSTTTPFNSINTTSDNMFASLDVCYTIIVGGTTFQLSATSLFSDSPNHFTDYFANSLTLVMNIDRDPEIFKDIIKHLQGYYVVPRDEVHYMHLTTDAVFYNLVKLKKQLRMGYMINVGGKLFQLNRELLETRDTPNYFTSIGFECNWEPPPNSLTKILPFIPSLKPSMIDRDPDLFAEIMRYLQGYDIEIKSEVQRQNLLKDSRFYRLRGLTEKLLASKLTLKNEILFHLKDVRTSNSALSLEKSLEKSLENIDDNNSNHMMQDDDNNSGNANSINNNDARNRIMYKNREGSLYYLLVQVNNTDLICRYDTLAPSFNRSVTTPPTPTNYNRESPSIPALELQLSKDDIKKLKNGRSVTFDVLTNVDKLSSLIKIDEFGNKILKLFVKSAILRLYVKDQKIGIEMLKCKAFSTEREFNATREFLD